MYSRLKIVVPDIKQSFQSYSNPSTISANIRMLQKIDATYGNTLTYWGNIFYISKGILAAFMATESGGNFFSVNKYEACGLMQVTPNAVWESVKKWERQTKTPLPSQARNLLNQKIPFIFTSKNNAPDGVFKCIGLDRTNSCTRYKEGTTGQTRVMIDALTTDNNFNIMCGTLVLRWLLERFKSPIQGINFGQLNKAIVAYNAGAYLRVLGGSVANVVPIDTTKLSTMVSSEPRNYLVKMLGKDGFMDLIYTKKAIPT
jgi:soluble lytic murein transglycosylase-like protein